MIDADLRENKRHGSADFPFHMITHTDQTGDYRVPLHWHPEVEVIYVEYGVLTLYCDDNDYHLTKGDLFIINSNSLHAINGLSQSRHHAIIFHPKLLDFNYYDRAQEEYIQPITSNVFHFRQTILKHKDFEPLLDSLLNNEQQDPLLIKILLYQIIFKLYRLNAIVKEVSEEKLGNIRIIISYIQSHYAEKIRLSDIAQFVGYSSNYVCKYFKKKMGITVFQYLNQYRIYHSLHLLKKTDKTILEIALECGFENDSYYIKTFKSIMKQTPKKYRNSERLISSSE